MKKYLAALAVVVFTSTSSFAQTAPAVDPALAAATKEMFAAMKIRDVMLETRRQIGLRMSTQLREMSVNKINNDPRLTAEAKKDALARLEKSIPTIEAKMHELLSDESMVDEMLEQSVPLYASIYTLDEIHQLSAFYQSPLAQKMHANMPKLMAEGMQIASRVMMPRMQKFLAQVAQGDVNK